MNEDHPSEKYETPLDDEGVPYEFSRFTYLRLKYGRSDNTKADTRDATDDDGPDTGGPRTISVGDVPRG